MAHSSAGKPLDISPDIAAARSFARAVRIACDELHDEPFSPKARAELLALIVNDSPEADAALARALAETDSAL